MGDVCFFFFFFFWGGGGGYQKRYSSNSFFLAIWNVSTDLYCVLSSHRVQGSLFLCTKANPSICCAYFALVLCKSQIIFDANTKVCIQYDLMWSNSFVMCKIYFALCSISLPCA